MPESKNASEPLLFVFITEVLFNEAKTAKQLVSQKSRNIQKCENFHRFVATQQMIEWLIAGSVLQWRIHADAVSLNNSRGQKFLRPAAAKTQGTILTEEIELIKSRRAINLELT